MRLAVHLGRILRSTFRFGFGGGRLAVIATVVIGLALVALAFGAKVVAPLAVYPFA